MCLILLFIRKLSLVCFVIDMIAKLTESLITKSFPGQRSSHEPTEFRNRRCIRDTYRARTGRRHEF